MDGKLIKSIIQVTAFTLTMVAICQELEKPEEKGTWHGRVAGVPYDFRFPTGERFKDTYWNPYETRLLTPTVFGVGWGVNLYALMENLRVIKPEDVSEESFLMPGEHMKEVLEHALESE